MRYISILVLAVIVGFAVGYKVKGGIEAEATLEAVEKAVEKQRAVAEKDLMLALEHAKAKTKIKTVKKYIDREVIKYVKANSDSQCFDDAARLLWNKAARGSTD